MRAAPAGMQTTWSPPPDGTAYAGSVQPAPYSPAPNAVPMPGTWAPPGQPGSAGSRPMSPSFAPMQPAAGSVPPIGNATRDWGYNAPGAIPRGQVLAQYGDLPGMSVPEAHAKPHRPMTEEELHRYNCPPGSIILATEEDTAKGGGIPRIENVQPGTEQEQIAAFLASRGLTPWTGSKQAVFMNGQPVPKDLFPYAPIPHAPDGYNGTLRVARN